MWHMLARVSLLFSLILAIGCGSSEEVFVGDLTAPVIYGTDDRVEVFDHPDPELQLIARESIVALMPTWRLNREPSGIYSITAVSLKDERGLCDDEPFGNQPVAASCSGVLIDDDLVLTAGHCISEQRPCDSFSYVFDYYLDEPSRLAAIEDEDVYACRRVVLEQDAWAADLTPDFAVVQLDRPVEGSHGPAAIRPASPLERGEPLTIIGFGSGLPAKIDSGGSVADPRAEQFDFFVANLDAFEGHSGSATFDSDNRLAGILLGGRVPDYVTSEEEGCARANVFEDSEAGEIVHSIAPIVAALCDGAWESESLCDPTACDGEPCGRPSRPSKDGSGVVPAASGCSAATASPGFGAFWLLLSLLVARRLRRTSA